MPRSVWQSNETNFPRFALFISVSFVSGSEIMPVILDNIQFYHGPSKPTKPPYFAFNSNQISSNTMVSGGQTPFTEPVSSPRDDSTIATACFLPPAANAVDMTHQHAVGSPNLFDFELARSWEVATPLLSPRDACDRDTCFSPQKPDCHHQDSSDENMPGDCEFKV